MGVSERDVLDAVHPTSADGSRPSGYTREFLLEMYRRMFLIRRFETKVNELFLKGHIPGTIHLSHGQEGVAVGVTMALGEEDVIVPTHRGHGHALAKGMPPVSLFAELFGRRDGCSRGKGGSLHICDFARGIMPANPVVGSSVPVAAGIAFAFRYRRQARAVACFFGDGAVNTGPLHEGANLAAIWDLPVVLVCENNQYAISTSIRAVVRVDRLSTRAVAYGMPGVTVDGNDVLAVHQAAREAVARARSGAGPTFLECITYRQGGHKRDDAATYRSQEEVAHWLRLDPLPRMRARLSSEPGIDVETIERLEAQVEAELDAAVMQALASPPPEPSDVLADVYA